MIAIVSSGRSDIGYLSLLLEIEIEEHIVLFAPTSINPSMSSDRTREFPCHISHYNPNISGFFWPNGLLKKLRAAKLVVILGDRYEILGLTVYLHQANVSILHLNGGDTSLGSKDETYRQMISDLATIHMPFSEAGRLKLIKRGISKSKIFLNSRFIPSQLGLRINRSGVDFQRKVENRVLIILHPNSLMPNNTKAEVECLFKVVELCSDTKFVWSHPNNDHGNGLIIDFFKENHLINLEVVSNIPEKRFFEECLSCLCVIGNSSMGILEAPWLGLPSINIGIRQEKRLHHVDAVIKNLPFDATKITKAIKSFGRSQESTRKELFKRLAAETLDKTILENIFRAL